MGTSDHIKYSDLVDIPKLQALMESFHQVTGVPNAVVDIDGFVIVKAGWQDACTQRQRRSGRDPQRRCLKASECGYLQRGYRASQERRRT